MLCCSVLTLVAFVYGSIEHLSIKMCKYIYLCVCIYIIYIYIFVCIYIYICTHIHTHTCTCLRIIIFNCIFEAQCHTVLEGSVILGAS